MNPHVVLGAGAVLAAWMMLSLIGQERERRVREAEAARDAEPVAPAAPATDSPPTVASPPPPSPRPPVNVPKKPVKK